MKIFFSLSDTIRKIRGRIFWFIISVTSQVFQRPFRTHIRGTRVKSEFLNFCSRFILMQNEIVSGGFNNPFHSFILTFSVNNQNSSHSKFNIIVKPENPRNLSEGIFCKVFNIQGRSAQKDLTKISVSYPFFQH